MMRVPRIFNQLLRKTRPGHIANDRERADGIWSK